MNNFDKAVEEIRNEDMQSHLRSEHRRIIEARQDEYFEAYSAYNNEEEDYWDEREQELNNLILESDNS